MKKILAGLKASSEEGAEHIVEIGDGVERMHELVREFEDDVATSDYDAAARIGDEIDDLYEEMVKKLKAALARCGRAKNSLMPHDCALLRSWRKEISQRRNQAWELWEEIKQEW